nr:M23 family metallopeptidase [Oscillospiraceae bacterium]
GDEIIKRNKRRRRVLLGVCSSAACLAAVIAVSLGEWAASRRNIDPTWSPSDSGFVTDPEAPEITGPNASASGDPASGNPVSDDSVNIINDPIMFVSETEASADSEPTAATSDRMPEEGKLLWPVGGDDGGVIVEMMYGYGGYEGHKGIDIQAPYGAPVYAAADGYVVDAVGDGYFNGGRGSYVVIEHDDGYATSYYHMSTVSVCSGQRVTAGDTIGEVGSSGETYGESLHFELRMGVDGTLLNPIDFLPEHKYAPYISKGTVGVVPADSAPVHITTVIDDFETDADARYDAPENGSVKHSIPLDRALEHYGDKDEYGNDVMYYIEVHFFRDGERVDAGDLIIREDEWNRISATGVQCEFMTSSENWGETHTHYFLLTLTKEEVENFVPSDDLGYMFYLVDEDGEGPVRINRDVIHLPAEIISEDTPFGETSDICGYPRLDQ